MNLYRVAGGIFLAFVLGLVSIGANADDIRRDKIVSINKSVKTLTLENNTYKVRTGAKVHDSAKKLASFHTLEPGMTIEYKTRNNSRTKSSEITEIWVIYF
ncbi:MAG: hypothetical protein OEZ39_04705 [Gammaproteobacteria bacterium]|nr:hypothetical protein [Gammaproteobacteria bacterium]MDH5651159.1 hypothetical protein [Gammaproteobacteria bacterium]